MKPSKPLSGLKILDFSAVYAGPICTRMLADCGAEVIKVEPPRGGDLIRGPKGSNRIFVHFNTGKQSIAIDLKSVAGQQLAKDLARQADVIVENFRPGVMEKFGLDYDQIKPINPGIIYCSISGFGQSGPYAKRAAYAPIAHATSGFDVVHMQTQDNSVRPAVWGIMIGDMLSGSYAFGAIQTALLGRHQTGKGEYIDVTMMESMMTLIPGQIQAAQLKGAPTPGGFHPIKVKDGFVMVCIVSEKNLQALSKAMGNPDILEDERFHRNERFKNIVPFLAAIESWSSELTAAECETKLNETGVPCSIYNAPEDLFSHPQLSERDVFAVLEDSKGEYFVQNLPFHFANTDISTAREVPGLGQHTDVVLKEQLGLTSSDIEKLREGGVVA